ncbi:MAG: 4Fe-4S binding protein [candidate division WOR-3 bacterium]|nr:4Fe-4S binding protein [candidate division WOR-3 bacterium]MCX7756887.1 4Fe-4S binding protein [candidate division WOR-3 bacterium]MDW7987389.1 4Fe-4S dicluster domain-containing protein [candidate division WOR-3 bacterium]
MTSQKRIFLDLDYCIGCRSCEAACYSAYGERRIRYGDISSTVFLPLACRHCDEPLCARACPFEVLRVTPEGLVIQASFHCVGCRSCILACPFGVLDKELSWHISQKCSLCYDRSGNPRCVASCPTGALKFITEKEISKKIVSQRFVARSPYYRRQ